MLKNEQELIKFVENDENIMRVLKHARSQQLPNWFIGAGFLRNKVWDVQHGFEVDYSNNDVDFCYYDLDQLDEKADQALQAAMSETDGLDWEIVNQAYAHKYNPNVKPYTSAEDGLAHWIETATCVGVTLSPTDEVALIKPWGIDDLLKLKVRLAPLHNGNQYYIDQFNERIQSKNWLKKWPKLVMINPKLPSPK